jgi:hypothetical protein
MKLSKLVCFKSLVFVLIMLLPVAQVAAQEGDAAAKQDKVAALDQLS